MGRPRRRAKRGLTGTAERTESGGGCPAVPEDTAVALRCYEAAGRLGDVSAKAKFGHVAVLQRSGGADDAEALQIARMFLEDSVAAGRTEGAHALAHMYECGLGGCPADTNRAEALYAAAAEAGDAVARLRRVTSPVIDRARAHR